VLQLIVLFYVLADFEAIHLRHENIREHHIGKKVVQPFDRLTPIAYTKYADALISKCKIDNFLNRDGIVGE
jgi:hypothetical protein